MMCLICRAKVDGIAAHLSLNTQEFTCSRCDLRLIDAVYIENKPFCYECAAIVRRGESVVVDYDAEKSNAEIINDLVLACEAALLLRGITLAINDPLALFSDKQQLRQRYIEIERQILGALENAKDLQK